MTKYIFVTGGVCSSLGKGIATASIGNLMKAAGFKVFLQKLDPYLNVDPGTMSPFQHGEVFVTDDGAETDLDLGHYERFVDEPLSKLSTYTTGKIYMSVLKRERQGEFLGGTIQIVPHITNAIKKCILEAGKESKADIVIVEIGGTVGDIEGQPFIESVRQLHRELGPTNVLFVHLTLLPYLMASKELKTKPTQMSVQELRRMGVNPDIILTRSDYPVPESLLKKIALFCDVDEAAVIPAPTVASIYEVPLNLEERKLGEIIAKKMQLGTIKPNLTEWRKLVKKIKDAKKVVKIGLAGKYTHLDDAYLSVLEAIKAACYWNVVKPEIVWIDTEKIESKDKETWKKLESCDGIVVPGGFGTRGVEGKIAVAKYARENKVPYLGLCLGAQIMTIEYARNVLRIKDATSEEFDPKAKNPVVHFLPGQSESKDKGGTLRLGTFPCVVKKGTKAFTAYKSSLIHERHRHRYEFNNKYRAKLEEKGLMFSGEYAKRNLMEIVEIKKHPFMVGSQFHPEFKSRPNRPHPLFREFITTIVKK